MKDQLGCLLIGLAQRALLNSVAEFVVTPSSSRRRDVALQQFIVAMHNERPYVDVSV